LLLAKASVSAQEVGQEAVRPPAVAAMAATPAPRAKELRPKHPGRDRLPGHLEGREAIIACHPQDCRGEQCGAERPVIGFETSEKLACDPARFYVRVIQREKRGSLCLPEHGVATAPAAAKILPKSKLANETIIEALVQKYQQPQPLYRQCAAPAQNHSVALSRQTGTGEVLAVGELLRGTCLPADETPVPVQTGAKTGRNQPHARKFLSIAGSAQRG
jgi:transposase